MQRLNLLKEYFDDLRPIVPYVGRWLLDFTSDIGVVVIYPVGLLLRGQFEGSVIDALWQVLMVFARYPMQLMLTTGALFLNALASFINNAFMQSHERPLSKQEIQYLQPIFGKNLDYAAIKIQTGGVKEFLKISPQAVGPDIFLRQVWGTSVFNEDSSLTPAGLRLLGHEACHVWQFQQTGAGYIGDSLITQVFDALGRRCGIHLSDGYDLQVALRAKRICKHCNVEQQAVMAELIGSVCSVHGSADISREAFNRIAGFHLDEAEFALVQDAHLWLQGLHAH